MLGILLAAALASASPAPGHCLDSFLAVGQPIAPPRDVARRVEHSKSDRVVRIDVLIEPALARDRSIEHAPMVGFLYVTERRDFLFGTRTRANVDAAVKPTVREIYAASSTATAGQLRALLARQNGNAIVYLASPLKLLRGLGLRAAPCAVLRDPAAATKRN